MRIVFFISVLISLYSIGQVKEVYIVSKMDDTFEMEDGTDLPYWGFGEYIPGGSGRSEFPGPLLEFELGDSVIIHFLNDSPEDHTIHLHGLDVEQAYDGVPATSVSVPANGTYDYHWKANHVGSFIYHCHVQTIMHSSLGMYGMIVVKNKPSANLLYNGGPGFNKEYNFLSSEIYTSWNLNPLSPGPFHLFDPDYFMINGKSGMQILEAPSMIIDAQPGDSVLLRLANIAFSKVTFHFPSGLNPVVYGSDGRIIPNPTSVDSLELFAGERYSVVLYPDQFVQSFIDVYYRRMYGDEFEGANQIAVNIDFNNVEEQAKENVVLFPNPTNGCLTIKSSQDVEAIVLYDHTGRIVKQWKNRSYIDVSSFPNGVYCLGVLSKGGMVFEKLIIESK